MFSVAARLPIMQSNDYSSSCSSDEETPTSSPSSSEKDFEKSAYSTPRSISIPATQQPRQRRRKSQPKKSSITSWLTETEQRIAIASLSLAGFNINHLHRDSAKAILWAAETGNTTALTYTLEHERNIRQAHRTVPFISKSSKPHSWLAATTNSYGTTPLHNAALAGDTAVVRTLLAFGANVNAVSKEHGTALHAASQHGHDDIIRLLLPAGASKDIETFHPVSELTPLQLAAAADAEDAVRILLNHGADPYTCYRYHNGPHSGDTRCRALHYAARHGNIVILHLLLEAGAEIDAEDEQGQTALHYAAAEGLAEISFLLVARGAAVRAVDGRGDTPLDVALRRGRREVVGLLLNGARR